MENVITKLNTDFNSLHNLSELQKAIDNNNQALLLFKQTQKEIDNYIRLYANSYLFNLKTIDAYIGQSFIPEFCNNFFKIDFVEGLSMSELLQKSCNNRFTDKSIFFIDNVNKKILPVTNLKRDCWISNNILNISYIYIDSEYVWKKDDGWTRQVQQDVEVTLHVIKIDLNTNQIIKDGK